MGAATFVDLGTGPTAKDAFDDLVDQARHENGAGGYTGSIAEKAFPGFTMIDPTEDTSNWSQYDYETWAWKLLSDDDERVADKRGPAGCTQLGNNEFLFFGWAPS